MTKNSRTNNQAGTQSDKPSAVGEEAAAEAADLAAAEQAAEGADPAAAEQAVQAKEPEGGWCYPILTPSTFRNVVVKEGFIQLTAEEAAPYLAAGVIGNDVCFPPNAEASE